MESAVHIRDAISYLTDAAHLMRESAPETSAHLMRQRGDLLIQGDLRPSDAQKQRSCGTCGNIIVPGDGSSIRLQRLPLPAKRKRQNTTTKRESKQPARTVSKWVTCGRCGKASAFQIGEPPKAARGKPKKASKQEEPPNKTTDPSTPKASANASSKKRAKSRKTGLSALLAANQRQKPRSLSLSDFMQ